ncbi:MAG: hypothetical protein WDN76_01545 [Alphaproteobacteria bacterium]
MARQQRLDRHDQYRAAWQLRLNWALGSIARAQVWRATQVLAKAPRDTLKIIVTHHPADLAGRSRPARRYPWRTEGGAETDRRPARIFFLPGICM